MSLTIISSTVWGLCLGLFLIRYTYFQFRINRLKAIISWLNDELPKNTILNPSYKQAKRHNGFDFSFYYKDSTRLFVQENMANEHYSRIYQELEILEYRYEHFLRREFIFYIVLGFVGVIGHLYGRFHDII